MALHQVAQALLASRGIQPTPENMSRAIAALEANPELAQRIAAGAQRGTSEQGETTQQNPVAAALADPFDVALTKAVNNGQPATAQQATPVVPGPVTQVAPDPITQPTPQIVPVTSGPLSVPPGVASNGQGQPTVLPSDFDAAAEAAAQQEFGATGEGDGGPGFPIPPPIIPAPAGRSTGTAIVPVERAAVQAGAQGALPRRKSVTADIERTIDVQDSPMKETVRAGKPAVEFELGGERMWVNEDGLIGNDTTKVIVREQSVLDRVRQFLLQNKSRFATLARIL